jgi:antitoxin HigA-1
MTSFNPAFIPERDTTHPGELIQIDILEVHKWTQEQLATRLGVQRRTINELVNKRRSLSPDMALRLSKLTGTSPEYWLNLQMLFDLSRARQHKTKSIDDIVPVLVPDEEHLAVA